VESTGILNDASSEDILQTNLEEAKYMLLPRHQHEGGNRDIKIVNSSCGNVP
jgi:hypothetical protein